MPFLFKQTNEEEVDASYDRLIGEVFARGGSPDYRAIQQSLPQPEFGPVEYLPPEDFNLRVDPIRFAARDTGLLLNDALKAHPVLKYLWPDVDIGVLQEFIHIARSLGVVSVRVGYNGGHDEGFAWTEHLELRGGRRVGPRDFMDQTVSPAQRNQLIKAAGITDIGVVGGTPRYDVIEWTLPILFVWMLLGQGYGTAWPSNYGALTVDMIEYTVRDDRSVSPPWARDAAP